MSYVIKNEKDNNQYYCGVQWHTKETLWDEACWAEVFKCKSQAKRIAIQLGLGYDAVIEFDEDKGNDYE